MKSSDRKTLSQKARQILDNQGMQKYCVLSIRENKEHKSPWFSSMKMAQDAMKIIKGKGYRAIIYID